MSLKVGIIGCGWVAQNIHLPTINQTEEFTIVALAEPNRKRLKEATQAAPEATCYDDYPSLLDDPEVEAVFIFASTDVHAEAAIAAFERGKKVYLEKPIATSLNEAEMVLDAWRHSDSVGVMGFNYRFNRLYQAMRDHIHESPPDEFVSVRTAFSRALRKLPDWQMSRETGGGVLLDLGAHHIDLLRFLFRQEIVEVACTTQSQFNEDDSALLQLRLEHGLVIQSFFSNSAVDEDRFEIYTANGKLTTERFTGSLDMRSTEFDSGRMAQVQRSLQTLSQGLRHLTQTPGEESYSDAYLAFAAAKRGEQGILATIEDGFQCMAVLAAAERSAAAGGIPVRVELSPSRI